MYIISQKGLLYMVLCQLSLVCCLPETSHLTQFDYHVTWDMQMDNMSLLEARGQSLVGCARLCGVSVPTCLSFDYTKYSRHCSLKAVTYRHKAALVRSIPGTAHYDDIQAFPEAEDVNSTENGDIYYGTSEPAYSPVLDPQGPQVVAAMYSSISNTYIVFTTSNECLFYYSLGSLQTGQLSMFQLSAVIPDWGLKLVDDALAINTLTYILLAGDTVHCFWGLTMSKCSTGTMLGAPDWDTRPISVHLTPNFPSDLQALTKLSNGTIYGFKGDIVYTSGWQFSLSSMEPRNIWRGIPAAYTAITETDNPDVFLVFVHDNYYTHNIATLSTTYKGVVTQV